MDDLAGYVATGVVSLAVGAALRYFESKPDLRFWSPHSFFFNLTNPDVKLQTDAFTIQNFGRKSAAGVEVIFSEEPDFYQLQPALQYSTAETPEGNFVLRLDSVGPREFFTIQILHLTKLPELLTVRSEAGHGRVLPFQLQRAFPQWFIYLLTTLMVIGAGFSIYWLIRAVIFISQSIGVLAPAA